MPAILETVSVVCDGYRLMGFQSVSITRSMQDGAMGFQLEASAASWSALALRKGKQIEIYSSPDLSGTSLRTLVLTGAVDDYDAEGTPSGRRVSLSGQSKARNAIDCHPVKHKTGLIKKKNLLQAAQEFDEFGIGWESDQQLETLPMIQRRPEETMFETIERYARRTGHMLVGQPSGKVMITRAGSKRHAGALVYGQSPVNTMGVKINTTHRHDPVVVRGQRRSGHGAKNLRQEVQDGGGDGDGMRPLLVIAEGDHSDDQLKTRAKWERLRRAGYAVRPRATVSASRDAAGELWTPGYLVPIRYDEEQVDGDFTLSTVTLSMKEGQGEGAGTRANLEFVDPRAHGGKAGAGNSDGVFSPGEGL